MRDYAELLHLTGDYGVQELRIGPDHWLSGRSLAELSLRDEGVMVLGIEREDGHYVGAPRGDTTLEAGDLLVLYGRGEALGRLDERPRGREGDLRHREGVADEQKERETQERREAERERGEANP